MGRKRRSIVLVHLRRTGGTSIQRRLATRFDVRECLLYAHAPDNVSRDPNAYAFIEGHIGLPYLRRFGRPPFVITSLRDPLHRAVSYHHLLRSLGPSDPNWELVKWTFAPDVWDRWLRAREMARRYALCDFIEREPELAVEWLGAAQSRALSDPAPAVGEERLADAIAGLERCDVVLLTERLDEVACWLGPRLGCGSLTPITHDSRAPGPRAADPLDERTRCALRELTAVDRELYAYAVDLYERRLTTWRAAGAPADPTLDWDPPPDGTDFTFDRPVHGRGWQPREQLEGRWFCWIGAERQAWIDLRVGSPGKHDLCLEIAHVLDPSIIGGVRVHANGMPVGLNASAVEGSVQMRGSIPAPAIERGDGALRLAFSAAATARPCDVDRTSNDCRELAIAVSRIRLTPAGPA